MKRRFGVMAMAAVLSAALAVPAYAGTWKYVNDQWKYQRGANKFAYNEWIQDKGKYYYLDNDGLAADRGPVVSYGQHRSHGNRLV